MADLLAGGGHPTTTNGNGASSRPTAAPAPTGSPGIRGPRMIMRDRIAREERQREERQRQEREQMERTRAEQDARAQAERILADDQRRTAERTAAAAAAAGASQGAGGPGSGAQQTVDPTTSRRQQAPHESQGRPAPGPSRVQPQSTPQTQQRQTRQSSGHAPAGSFSMPQATNAPPMGGAGATTGESSTAGAPRGFVNRFPHAFERWETLSAHWEGLTSHWIRQLEQNRDAIERDPLNQQLARQVTDLSAAGANLFHAVVELQRLRASSERKFQRWFFETRGDIERLQEVSGMLERALEDERAGRANAIRDAVQHERDNSRTQKLLNEMKKELQISKEEARRAWEELGRREQEERDRTMALQQGLPTLFNGVQVVPMTQGVPSRGNTRVGQPPLPPQQPQPQQQPQPSQMSSYERQQEGYPEDYSQAPPVQPSTTAADAPQSQAGFYQQPEAAGHGQEEIVSYIGSEAGYSEGEYLTDAQGNYVRDAQGNRVPYRGSPSNDGSDPEAGEFETPASQPPSVPYPPSSSQYYSSGAADYSGTGYAAPGWEAMPRHHHPTRLSDVMEEDERSRTSGPSAISRGR